MTGPHIFRMLVMSGTLAFASSAHSAETIGAATGITNEVTGRLGSTSEQMHDGDPIFQNQMIATGRESQAQFEFSDQTNLAVSENSSIVIDRHVFDPDTGTGEIALNAVGGAFRFVTGLVPKDNITINTPTATLGVRGTTFDLYVHENGEAAVSLIDGEVEVCNARRACKVLNSVGKVMHITVDGIISEARDWSDNLVRGVQYAAAFPFLATSKRGLNKAFYATGRAADRALDGGKRVGRATAKGATKAAAAGADLAEDTGDAVVKGSRKAGKAASRTGRKAGRAAKRGGRKVFRKLKKVFR